MKKEHMRDYVVNMFRCYAFYNKPDKEEIEKLKDELNTAAVLDLEAVDVTLRNLDKITRAAVEEIYFTNPAKKLRRDEIEKRVISFSATHFIDRSSTYRKLNYARKICAQYRNLNLGAY